MTKREETIDAIWDFARAEADSLSYFGSDTPRIEDYFTDLLPDENDVPPWMELAFFGSDPRFPGIPLYRMKKS